MLIHKKHYYWRKHNWNGNSVKHSLPEPDKSYQHIFLYTINCSLILILWTALTIYSLLSVIYVFNICSTAVLLTIYSLLESISFSGLTQANADKILQGQLDYPLNDQGRKQVYYLICLPFCIRECRHSLPELHFKTFLLITLSALILAELAKYIITIIYRSSQSLPHVLRPSKQSLIIHNSHFL